MTDELAVLCTTANRAASLERTLESLCRIDSDGLRWRVVVVDNASTDDTPTVLSHYEKDTRLPLVALYEPRAGKSRAVNRGLEVIEAGLVLFIDDDVVLEPQWLQSYARGASHWPDVGIFGGRITPVFPSTAPKWVRQEEHVHQSAMFAAYAPRDDEGLTNAWPLGPNMAVRRDLIGALRFDVRFGPGGDYNAMGNETEFVSRLITGAGAGIVYLPDAAASHVVRDEQLSRQVIWARAFKWGRSRGLVDEAKGKGRRVLGVPVKVFFSAARAFVRFSIFYFGPRRLYLKYGWRWQVRAGRVSGYRELHRRSRGRE